MKSWIGAQEFSLCRHNNGCMPSPTLRHSDLRIKIHSRSIDHSYPVHESRYVKIEFHHVAEVIVVFFLAVGVDLTQTSDLATKRWITGTPHRCFYFNPLLRDMIQIDLCFQIGWNHELVFIRSCLMLWHFNWNIKCIDDGWMLKPANLAIHISIPNLFKLSIYLWLLPLSATIITRNITMFSYSGSLA